MIRVKASINPKHRELLTIFVGRAYNKDGTLNEPEAEALLRDPAFQQSMRDMGGAINAGVLYDDGANGGGGAVIDILDGAQIMRGTVKLFQADPGVVYAVCVGEGNSINWSVTEDGQGVWGHVAAEKEASFPLDDKVTAWGTRTPDPLPIAGGQWYMMRSDAGKTLSARVSVQA